MRSKVLSMLACLCLAAACVVAVPVSASAEVAGGGALNYGRTLYSEDFSQLETAGGLPVKDGKVVASSDITGKQNYDLPIKEFTGDFELSVEVNFPAAADSFFGMNIHGMTRGETTGNNTFECTVHAYDTPDAFVNDWANDKTLYLYSGAGGAKLVRGETAKIVMRRVGLRFTIIVNDVIAVDGNLPEAAVLTPTGMNMFVSGAPEGMTIDNIVIKEIAASTEISSLTVTSNKESISTMQSATLTAAYTPDSAKADSYKWYVGGVLQEGKTSATFQFSSKTVGSYAIKCAVNDVMSEEVTVTVTEATDDEKNALYYEDFNAYPDNTFIAEKPPYNFKVVDGALVSNGAAYTRYDMKFDYVQNFDASVDVIFTDAAAAGAYAGITVSGLDEPGREAEFNLHRMPAPAPAPEPAPATVAEGDEPAPVVTDHAVIKYNGNEKYFSYDADKGGVLPEFAGFEANTPYRLRVVRYDDQFEVYIGEALAIKSYLLDPAVPTNMFIFSIGGNVTFDNLVVRAAQEITDRVEPPKVDATSAYVTVSNISPKVGEKITLNVGCIPFDATPETFQWYVNDTLIEGATAATYEFTPSEAGIYTFTCVVDGTVTSEPKAIEAIAKPDDNEDDSGDKVNKKGCGAILLGGGGTGMGLGLMGMTLLGAALIAARRKKSMTR